MPHWPVRFAGVYRHEGGMKTLAKYLSSFAPTKCVTSTHPTRESSEAGLDDGDEGDGEAIGVSGVDDLADAGLGVRLAAPQLVMKRVPAATMSVAENRRLALMPAGLEHSRIRHVSHPSPSPTGTQSGWPPITDRSGATRRTTACSLSPRFRRALRARLGWPSRAPADSWRRCAS